MNAFPWRDKFALVALLAILQFGDVLTTNRVLAQGGVEANPISAYFLERFGAYWWAPKLMLVLMMLTALPFVNTIRVRTLFIVINLLYCGVMLNNVIVHTIAIHFTD